MHERVNSVILLSPQGKVPGNLNTILWLKERQVVVGKLQQPPLCWSVPFINHFEARGITPRVSQVTEH